MFTIMHRTKSGGDDDFGHLIWPQTTECAWSQIIIINAGPEIGLKRTDASGRMIMMIEWMNGSSIVGQRLSSLVS